MNTSATELFAIHVGNRTPGDQPGLPEICLRLTLPAIVLPADRGLGLNGRRLNLDR